MHSRKAANKLHNLCNRRNHPAKDRNESPDSDSDSDCDDPVPPGNRNESPDSDSDSDDPVPPRKGDDSNIYAGPSSYPPPDEQSGNSVSAIPCLVEECDFQAPTVYAMRLHELMRHTSPPKPQTDKDVVAMQSITRTLRSLHIDQGGDQRQGLEEETDENGAALTDQFQDNQHIIRPYPVRLDGYFDGSDLAYISDFQAIVCMSCRVGLKKAEVLAHLKRHKGFAVKKKKLEEALGTLQYTIEDDRSNFQMPIQLPLMDFLRLQKPDDDEPLGFGYCCIVDGCHFASMKKKTMHNHIYQNHPERGGRTASQCWERGYVQQLFTTGFGSLYFRVTPLLNSVVPGSPFEGWFRKFCEPTGFQRSVLQLDTNEPGNIDTFVKKVGWLTQVKGYSQKRLRGLTSIPNPRCHLGESDPQLRKVSIAYLHSIGSQEFSTVHPIYLKKLNHWKKHQPPFTLLSTAESVVTYANTLRKLCLLVLRIAHRKQDCNVNIQEVVQLPSFGKNTVDSGEELDIADLLLNAGTSFVNEEEEEESDDDEYNERDDKEGLADSDGDDDEPVESDEDEDDLAESDEFEDDSTGSDEDEDDLPEGGVCEDHPKKGNKLDISDSPDSNNDYPVFLSREQEDAALELLIALNGSCATDELLLPFHKLVLSLFTTQIDGADKKRHHTALGAMLISSNMCPDGSFRPTVNITPDLSRLQYIVLFAVLKQGLIEGNIPGSLEKLACWYKPDVLSPFALIRYYQNLGWFEVKHMIGVPRLLFYTQYGPEFQFDGVKTSVLDWIQMVQKLLGHAEKVLQEDLLMGLTDESLGICVESDLSDNVDVLNSTELYYGIFSNSKNFKERLAVIMLKFMETANFSRFYYLDEAREPQFTREPCHQWLCSVQEFKETIYAIIHIAAGLPKRATEAALTKVMNIPGRRRSVVNMLDEIFIIGDYSKTTALAGADKVTLHMLPPVVKNLLIRFYRSAALLEEYFVGIWCPQRSVNYNCYLYSSMGQQWKRRHFYAILKRVTKQYLGKAFNISQIRHILPGIAGHYQLGLIHRYTTENIIAAQSGHSQRMLDRRYQISLDSHPQLTSTLVSDTIVFSKRYHRFWGVTGDHPVPHLAEDLLALSGEVPSAVKLDKLEEILVAINNFIVAVGGVPADIAMPLAPAQGRQTPIMTMPIPPGHKGPPEDAFLDIGETGLGVSSEVHATTGLLPILNDPETPKLEQGWCPECQLEERFLTLDHLRKHMSESHPKSYTFTIATDRKRIHGTIYRAQNDLMFHCACKQTFESRSSAMNHIDSICESSLKGHTNWIKSPAWRLK